MLMGECACLYTTHIHIHAHKHQKKGKKRVGPYVFLWDGPVIFWLRLLGEVMFMTAESRGCLFVLFFNVPLCLCLCIQARYLRRIEGDAGCPWRCKWLWATMRVLRIELESSVRAAGAPNPWATSTVPLPSLVFNVSRLLPLPFRV